MISRNIMNILNIFVSMIFIFVFNKIIGFAGTGLLISTLLIFYFFFTIMMGSIRTALARMVLARRNRGFNDNAKKIYKSLIIYTILVGIIMFIVFRTMPFFLSKLFLGHSIAGDVLSYCSIFFLFHSLCNCMIGNYLGNEKLNIIAISEITSFIVLLISSPILVKKMANYGEKVSLLLKNDIMLELYACKGALIALCLSSFVMLVILIIGSKGSFTVEDYLYNELRGNDGLKSFMRTFLPIAFGIFKENIFPIITVIFTVVIYSRNIMKNASSLRDMFNNLGLLFMLSFLTLSFGVISFKEYMYKQKKLLHQDFKHDENKNFLLRYNYLIANTLLLLLPIMLALIFFAGDISVCIFGVENEALFSLIRFSGILALLMGIDIFFKTTLESMGGTKIALMGELAGFTATLFYLIAIGKNELTITNILISLVLNYFIICMIHGFFTVRYIGIKVNILLVKLIKIAISTLGLIILDVIFAKLFNMNFIILITAVLVGYILYYSLIIGLKTYSEKDISSLEGSISYYPINLGVKIFSGK